MYAIDCEALAIFDQSTRNMSSFTVTFVPQNGLASV